MVLQSSVHQTWPRWGVAFHLDPGFTMSGSNLGHDKIFAWDLRHFFNNYRFSIFLINSVRITTNAEILAWPILGPGLASFEMARNVISGLIWWPRLSTSQEGSNPDSAFYARLAPGMENPTLLLIFIKL